MNKVTLVGRIGKDPELKYTPSGSAVCKFTVATDNGKDSNGEKRVPDWHNIVVWEKQALNCAQYLKKGREVAIEGSIHTRSWDDQNGVKKYMTEIKAHNVEFIGAHDSGGQQQQEQEYNHPAPVEPYPNNNPHRQPPQQQQPYSAPDNSQYLIDDDLPF